MRRGINAKEQGGKKTDDREGIEKGKCIQKIERNRGWPDTQKAAGAALLSAYVSPAQLLALFLLDSMTSVQLSSV